mmetsp:Transcript_1674/g.3726  ORF Transcript_1674/g.3726 Transcript_1674/m.3726 type:complete len:83 (-) Transcript_1674:175-423(-)
MRSSQIQIQIQIQPSPIPPESLSAIRQMPPKIGLTPPAAALPIGGDARTALSVCSSFVFDGFRSPSNGGGRNAWGLRGRGLR